MEAWVTLATNDTYALGCLVLAQSLRRVETNRRLHCLLTPGVSAGMRESLSAAFDETSLVDVLGSEDAENLQLIGRPELGVTFTKLHCWRLTNYAKCVFLDADTLVLQNSDELFSHDELSAAPDTGWPDMFNSGVFVFRPSLDTYRALIQLALECGSFDGGDQGLLNTYFSDWREKDAKFRLSFVYNMSSGAVYTYAAAYKKFGKDVKIVHFLGAVKPWHHSYGGQGLIYRAESHHTVSHVQKWWSVFLEQVEPTLSAEYPPSTALSPTPSEITAQASDDISTTATARPLGREIAFDALVLEYLPSDPTISADLSQDSDQRPVERRPVVAMAYGSETRMAPAPEEKPRPTPGEAPQRAQPTRLSEPPQRVYRVKLEQLRSEKSARELQPRGDEAPSTAEAPPPEAQFAFTHPAFEPVPRQPPPALVKPSKQERARQTSYSHAVELAAALTDAHSTSSSSAAQPTDTSLVGPIGRAGSSQAMTDLEHKQAWESGQVDYLGRDSWENIQKALDKSLGKE